MGPITYSHSPVDETVPGLDDAAAQDSAEQAQLSFFDAEAPPTMNAEQPDSENPEMPTEADAAPYVHTIGQLANRAFGSASCC